MSDVPTLPPWHPGPSYYAHLTGSAIIKDAPGVLIGVLIGTSANGSITLYDGLDDTGDVITVITSQQSDQASMVPVNTYFNSGLYVDTGSTDFETQPGKADITVIYQ